MKRPIQITFRDMSREPTLERLVVRKVTGLERYCQRITGCRILVAAPHRRHRNGRQYQVRVDLTIPGSQLVVRRDAAHNGRHESVRVAIHDAFDAARRILLDVARRRRAAGKRHRADTGFEDRGTGARARLAGELSGQGPHSGPIMLAGRRERPPLAARP